MWVKKLCKRHPGLEPGSASLSKDRAIIDSGDAASECGMTFDRFLQSSL